eukprot:comp12461_c0_seq1/m.7395 comp12461_c0_seq1/g.7395  ORF comp12461_c0_seq1/g.7395 comp12461_c0_seq1/m.7395 type:complete len:302 (+) comp12461_c0_seq1:792-1697(+)
MAVVGHLVHGPAACLRGVPHVDVLAAVTTGKPAGNFRGPIKSKTFGAVARKCVKGVHGAGGRGCWRGVQGGNVCANIVHAHLARICPHGHYACIVGVNPDPVNPAIVFDVSRLQQRVIVSGLFVTLLPVAIVVKHRFVHLRHFEKKKFVVWRLVCLCACNCIHRHGELLPVVAQQVRDDIKRQARPLHVDRVQHVVCALVCLQYLPLLQFVTRQIRPHLYSLLRSVIHHLCVLILPLLTICLSHLCVLLLKLILPWVLELTHLPIHYSPALDGALVLLLFNYALAHFPCLCFTQALLESTK